MQRYHPFLVTLHWLLAAVIIFWLMMGHSVLEDTPNTNPEKVDLLRVHMAVGIGILVFMLVRLLVRWRSVKPGSINATAKLNNKLTSIGHYALYVVAILMSVSGIVAAQMLGLGEIVFFDSGAPLPETFERVVPLLAHKLLSVLLMALIIGHVLAALYHQFALKEKLFGRIWFGSRH